MEKDEHECLPFTNPHSPQPELSPSLCQNSGALDGYPALDPFIDYSTHPPVEPAGYPAQGTGLAGDQGVHGGHGDPGVHGGHGDLGAHGGHGDLGVHGGHGALGVQGGHGGFVSQAGHGVISGQAGHTFDSSAGYIQGKMIISNSWRNNCISWS